MVESWVFLIWWTIFFGAERIMNIIKSGTEIITISSSGRLYDSWGILQNPVKIYIELLSWISLRVVLDFRDSLSQLTIFITDKDWDSGRGHRQLPPQGRRHDRQPLLGLVDFVVDHVQRHAHHDVSTGEGHGGGGEVGVIVHTRSGRRYVCWNFREKEES